MCLEGHGGVGKCHTTIMGLVRCMPPSCNEIGELVQRVQVPNHQVLASLGIGIIVVMTGLG